MSWELCPPHVAVTAGPGRPQTARRTLAFCPNPPGPALSGLGHCQVLYRPGHTTLLALSSGGCAHGPRRVSPPFKLPLANRALFMNRGGWLSISAFNGGSESALTPQLEGHIALEQAAAFYIRQLAAAIIHPRWAALRRFAS